MGVRVHNHRAVSLQVHAQHSVQRIFGSLRLREAFFWLRVFSTSQTESQPAQNPLTPTVGRLAQKQLVTHISATIFCTNQRLRL